MQCLLRVAPGANSRAFARHDGAKAWEESDVHPKRPETAPDSGLFFLRAWIAEFCRNACAVECSRCPNRPKVSHCRINGAGAAGAGHGVFFVESRILFFAGHGGQERYCRKPGRLLRMQLMTCSLFRSMLAGKETNY